MPRIKLSNLESKIGEFTNVSLRNLTPAQQLGNNSITVGLAKKSFSFKSEIDEENLLNPNILENSKNLKNENLSLNANFDNQEDPIYDLDDGIDNQKIKTNDKQEIILNVVNYEFNRGISKSKIRTSRANTSK
jgi:hypothetical protein